MTRDESPDEQAPADEALAAASRAGDDEAFAELWRRHASAGGTAARQYAHIADADDLLAEAYARILASFRRGNGPSGAFRPYLYRTIRNLAMDWRRPATVALDDAPDGELLLPGPESAAVEREVGFRAFRSLPPRWQSVLWYLEVEGLEPAEAAPLLGLSANATSALAGRAREGLKKAWLQAHVGEHGVPEGCRWTTDRMGEYARGGLTGRGRERFARHLETCERCTALLAEVEDAGGRLAVLLLPFLIGGSGLAGVLAERGAGGDERVPDAGGRPGVRPSASRSGAGTAAASSAAARPALIAVGAVVVVAVVTGVTLAFGLPTDPGEVELPTAESPWPTEEPTPPEETPEPTPEPTPSPTPPRVTPPVVSPPVVPPPPAPVAPAAPSAPVVDLAHATATGLLRVSGTGDVPGATIEIWGTTTSPVTDIVSPETLLASTVVAPDGTWTTPDAGGITPFQIRVAVRQVRDGLASPSVQLISEEAFFGTQAVSTTAAMAGSTATWQLKGWPGGYWEIREPGGPAVASGVFAADGTAVASVVLPAVPSGTILDYEYGYVLEGYMGPDLGLTATAP